MNCSVSFLKYITGALLILSIPFLVVGQQGPGQTILPRYTINPEALNSPEFQEMQQETQEFLNKLSPEEMEEFVSFYEEFLKGVESGEIDLQEFLPQGLLQPLTPEQAEQLMQQPVPAPMPAEEPTPAPVPSVSVEDINDAIAMLTDIIEQINLLLTKAESDPTISDSLAPWKERLQTLSVYLTLLAQKKHVQHIISNDEHKKLLTTLKELRKQLKNYVAQVTIPEFGLGVLQKQEKEASKRALQKVIEILDTALTTNTLLDDIEKVFTKYEPEALKKAQTMLAAQERAKQPIPSTGPSYYSPLAAGYEPSITTSDKPSYYSPSSYDYAGGYDYGSPSYWASDSPDFSTDFGQTKPTMPATTDSKGISKGSTAGEKTKDSAGTKDKETTPGKSSVGQEKQLKELEKIANDIDKIVEMLTDDLIPDDKKVVSFTTALLDPNAPTKELTTLNKINDELGRLNRKSGQLISAVKKAKASDSYTKNLNNQLKEVSQAIQPLYQELRTVALPTMLDTQNAQAIDTCIKNCELLFNDFKKLPEPTKKQKLKKPIEITPAAPEGAPTVIPTIPAQPALEDITPMVPEEAVPTVVPPAPTQPAIQGIVPPVPAAITAPSVVQTPAKATEESFVSGMFELPDFPLEKKPASSISTKAASKKVNKGPAPKPGNLEELD